MTTEETGNLLAACASFDNRKVGALDVIAWKRAIGDLPYEDCEAAVIAHYGDSTERIMPGHIRTRVKAMRRERLDREIVPALPAEPGRYKAELDASIKRIADGRSVQLAIGGPVREGPPPVEWTEARKARGAALPGQDKELTPQEIALQQVAESRAARSATADSESEEGEPAA